MTKRPICLACLLLLVLLCGALWLGFPIAGGNPMPESLQEWAKHAPEATICGEVQYSADTQYAQSVYLKNVFLIRKSRKIPIEHVRAFLKEKRSLKTGAVLVLSGKLQPVPKPRNPGEFDSASYYAAKHIFYYLKEGVIEKESKSYAPWQQLLQELCADLAASLRRSAGKQAPVFEAVVLGEKKDLEQEQTLLYQMGGISHVMAISGVKTLKLDIPLVPETRINWAFVPLHIAIIYILKLCLDEEIIPRCRFPCSRGYLTKCINWQKKQ